MWRPYCATWRTRSTAPDRGAGRRGRPTGAPGLPDEVFLPPQGSGHCRAGRGRRSTGAVRTGHRFPHLTPRNEPSCPGPAPSTAPGATPRTAGNARPGTRGGVAARIGCRHRCSVHDPGSPASSAGRRYAAGRAAGDPAREPVRGTAGGTRHPHRPTRPRHRVCSRPGAVRTPGSIAPPAARGPAVPIHRRRTAYRPTTYGTPEAGQPGSPRARTPIGRHVSSPARRTDSSR